METGAWWREFVCVRGDVRTSCACVNLHCGGRVALCAAVAGVQMECPSEALGSIKRLGDGGSEGGWEGWKDEKGNGVGAGGGGGVGRRGEVGS